MIKLVAFIFLTLTSIILLPQSPLQAAAYTSPSDIVTQNKLRKDIDLAWTVKNAIATDSRFSFFADNINVAVRDGTVTLTGYADSQKSRVDLEVMVRSISGVSRVFNYVQIR